MHRFLIFNTLDFSYILLIYDMNSFYSMRLYRFYICVRAADTCQSMCLRLYSWWCCSVFTSASSFVYVSLCSSQQSCHNFTLTGRSG